VTIFCVHDADAAGTMIYQTFQEATKARDARKIKIINLGLEPWEAVAMGLSVENLEACDRAKPVADYVRNRPDGTHWVQWLQTHRVELNAMTTPQLINWLDHKMVGYEKLIPPLEVLSAELDELIKKEVRANLTEKILREARFEEQVASTIADTEKPAADDLAASIRQSLKEQPDRQWREYVERAAKRAADGGAQ
jgi:hypothetical protein